MLNGMRRKYKTILNFIMIGCLTAGIGFGAASPLAVEATNISEIQGQISQHTTQLENINNQIVALESEQDILKEQIDDLNAEITNMMASIGLKEDEITQKEGEIAQKEGEIARKEEEIVQKQDQIVQTEDEYKAAMEREAAQRETMAIWVRMVYESGEGSYLDAILAGKGLSDILNQMDRVEKVHEYENAMLREFVEMKDLVHQLWLRLEDEKAALEADRKQLEADRGQLEADREQLKADEADLQGQKSILDGMLARKKKESANFEAEIKKAKQEAAVAKKLLQQDKANLARAQAAQNASGSGGGAAVSPGASAVAGAAGSALGKQIAEYALRYVGNPYVLGGTSLTNGADCSGFTYRVYSDFGYSISRTSYQQRSNGTGVSYSEAQPGDLICYEGHVGMYIGNGLIVHASNSNPYPSGGIKVSQAQYRPILAVRRIVN